MSMRINTNLDALNAQRNLATTGLAYSKSVQKLSSGMRINSAADDAAGLTISEKLRAQTSGLAQASRNAQDGISMIQTGEGALNETASILQRMRELTVQAGNDTLQGSDRNAIKSEVDQLSSEINRISSTTQFNGKTLLDGTFSAKGTVGTFNTLGGANIVGSFTASASNVTAPVTAGAPVITGGTTGTSTGAGNLVINGTTVSLANTQTQQNVVDAINATAGLGATGAVTASIVGGKLTLTGNTTGSSSTVTIGTASSTSVLKDLGLTSGATSTGYAAQTAASAGSYTVALTQSATAASKASSASFADNGPGTGLAGNLVINGVNIAIVGTDTATLIAGKISAAGSATGVTASQTGSGTATATLSLLSTAKGSGAAITLSDSTGGTILAALNLTAPTVVAGKDAAGTYTAPGSAAAVAFTAQNGTTLTGGGLTLDTSGATFGSQSTGNTFTAVVANSQANLQIGANSGQTFGMGIEDMSANALGVANLSVASSSVINTANTGTLALIDKAIASVSEQRATLGAYQNRLEHTISNLGVSASNLTASESRIRDVDMAAEMVNFTKTGILQQAGQAILAQANQSGSGVMSLLR